MSKFRTIAKEGWHPKSKDGGEESWRSDFKGINQVAGWMGKGKDSSGNIGGGGGESSGRSAAPLSSLKDPSSFGPPPKHTKYYGSAANESTVPPAASRSNQGYQDTPQYQSQPSYSQPSYAQPAYSQPSPSHSQEYTHDQYEQPEEEKPAPAPYRVNTTGLKTDHLPPPPRRTDSSASPALSSSSSRPKPPSVPPRLPVRTNSAPVQQDEPSPPPVYSPIPHPSEQASDGYINQGATSRLANAGVSVPGLEIGQRPARPTPPPPPRRQPQSPASGGVRSSVSNFRDQHSDKIDAGKQKISGLSQRFGSNNPSSDSTNAQPASSGGVRASVSNFRDQHSDKIDAGKQKMSNFREQHSDKIDAGKQKMGGLTQRFNSNPSSPADPHGQPEQQQQQSSGGVRSSVNNFREQHSDKIDAGKQKMSGLSQRVNTYVDSQKSIPSSQRPSQPSTPDSPAPPARKKPPPPPPKRAEIRASTVASSSAAAPAPPPVPTNTRPR